MNTKYWTAFSSIEQLDSTFIQRLYNYFGDIETAWNSNISDLKQIEGLSVKRAENFIEKKKNVLPEQTLDFILNKKINILTYDNPKYPFMLRQISNPPMTLFYKGARFISTYTDMRFSKTIKESILAIENNESIVIFPENSSDGYHDELKEFHPGFYMIADKCYQKYQI